tara:strand:+ start:3295 stop:4782 length:1488 start_codon:yes stop_codon:yes gene_type:complete
MADKQVKINALQAGGFNQKQNLIDFVIPSGMTVDMAKSYVNLQCHCETDQSHEGVFDFKLVYNHKGEHALTAPNTAIVRNCNLKSANKGMLEDVRRSDVLRTNLHYLSKTTEDDNGSLYKEILQNKTRTNHAQSIWRDLKGEGVVPSRALEAPIQIPMSDLFNLGNATLSTDYLGDTRVHLEICPERFIPKQLYDGELSTDFANPYCREMQDISGQNSANFDVRSKAIYQDLADSPFWIGMPIGINYKLDVSGQAQEDVSFNTIISEIEYERFASGDPYGKLGDLKITLGNAFPKPTVFSPDDVFSDIKIHGRSASDFGGLKFSINYAELMLQETDPVKMDGMVYSTWTLQETNGYGATNWAEQFIVEPNAYNIMALALNDNDLLTQKEEVKEFRIRVNNVDATDRNVVVPSPLYLDRISMFKVNNGEALKSAVLAVPSATADDQTSRYSTVPLTPYIVNALPVTPSTKVVDLNVVATGGGVEKVCVFKAVIKQL